MTLSASVTARSLCWTLSCGSRAGLRDLEQHAVRTSGSWPYHHGTCGVGGALRRSHGQWRFIASGGGGGEKEGGRPKKRPLIPTRLLASLNPHENIYTVPNILTLSRLLSAPVIGYLIIHEQHLPALALFVYAGITDLVDGWIARKWKLQTVVGTVIDPMADKTLMTVVTVCLAVKAALPVPLAVLILGRDVVLGFVALYYRYISLPAPKTLARYWDFSLPSVEVRPTGISKANTALQLGLVGWTMSGMAIGGDLGMWGEEGALRAMWYLVGATTIWSGASYTYTKDAVKILNAVKRPQSSGKA